MVPTIGCTVLYTLGAEDALQVNRRRADAQRSLNQHRANADGSMVHMGNSVAEGDVFPMVIVRAWGETEESSVNGQVLLDGSDTLWVTSVGQGDGVRQWRQPPRV